MFLESVNIFHLAHASKTAGKEPEFSVTLSRDRLLTVDHHVAKIDTISIKYGNGIVFTLRPNPKGISKIKLNNLPKGKLKVELVRQGKTYTQKFRL